MTGDQTSRPTNEQTGAAFSFDIRCLTSEQQMLWEEHFGGLRQWACGSTWQVTLMELWSFDEICMMDVGSLPIYPPEIQVAVGNLSRRLGEYLRNIRTGRKPNTTK